MVDYMVKDFLYNDYCVFATEEEARGYIKESLDNYPEMSITDFAIYKRERIAL